MARTSAFYPTNTIDSLSPNQGGQFEPAEGGQFEMAEGGQFSSAKGGQFEWVFHSTTRYEIARNLKLLHEKKIRFILIGISSSAEEMVGVDGELGIRNDPFELKTQSEDFVIKVIDIGSAYLNIRFDDVSKSQILSASNLIPSVVHIICRIALLANEVFHTEDNGKVISVNLKDLKGDIVRIFDSKYFNKMVALTKGKQQARSVHNTYFDIISIIASDNRSEFSVEYLYDKIVRLISDPKERGKKATSFYNCLHNLEEIIEENGVQDLIHYNTTGKSISIEDPSLSVNSGDGNPSYRL